MDNATVTDFPEPYKSIRNYVNKSIIIIVVLAIFGNIMIVKVMLRKENRNSSTFIFFIALAISDMSISGLLSLERWLHWVFGINLYSVNKYVTTVETIMHYSFYQTSIWILMCITLERLTIIISPFKFKLFCTKTHAIVISVMVCTLIMTMNIIQFTVIVRVDFDAISSYNKIMDIIKNGYTIIAVMDSIIAFFLPVVIIVTSSIYIIIHLHRQKMLSIKTDRNRSVTMTLLAANIVFLLTTSPFVLLQLISLNVNISPYLFWTLFDIFLFLADMNSALNFYVYVLSGSKFRSDVKKILGFPDRQSSS